jgi:hypothetical protein
VDIEIKFKQSVFRHGVSEADIRQEKIMETMTEEEAFALDEYYTNNPPTVDPSKARVRIPMGRGGAARQGLWFQKCSARPAHKKGRRTE